MRGLYREGLDGHQVVRLPVIGQHDPAVQAYAILYY